MTTHRYPFLEVLGETKRAWLVAVPGHNTPVKLPKKTTVFDGERHEMVVDDQAAAFVGLSEEERV